MEVESELTTAEAIQASLTSAAEDDRNGDPANVVDGLFAISRELARIAKCLEENSGIPPEEEN